MRLVVDTNVLLAAFITRGICHDLLEHCAREHHLVSSEFILQEFEQKLIRKLEVPFPKARSATALVRSRSELVEPIALERPTCRDPDDHWVIATVVAGRCDCIVTGDNDLLALNTYQRIRILAPNAFWTFEAMAARPGP